jgi:hypothetical protein
VTPVETFESTVLLPAYDEICRSPALAREHTAQIVTARPHADASIEELVGSLARVLRKRSGPALVISAKERPDDLPPIGGHYVVIPFYEEDDGMTFVSPGVVFWMRFNNKLHVFDHRYDDGERFFAVEDATRAHVLNHVLRSFDFYKLHALSDRPFPGYGR